MVAIGIEANVAALPFNDLVELRLRCTASMPPWWSSWAVTPIRMRSGTARRWKPGAKLLGLREPRCG